MPRYDGDLFSPPAPLARVTLRNPQNGAVVSDVPMLLDTGADVTLLPRSYVGRLGDLPPSGADFELTGFDGRMSVSSAVRVDLLLLIYTFRGEFLQTDQEWGVLGRDVLNKLPLLFDGPRSEWRVQR